ncbi:hypothetical protein GWK47_010162 [Chionoecetes opilio]|uniref:Uncharacterized protein n=1 Tax=Chionoecetes opilio TaxID=41210 RepID=A0A8J5CN94_CHIOP|nr:hypothetical protein GWK47_010162 [Chionoecetes opilio]
MNVDTKPRVWVSREWLAAVGVASGMETRRDGSSGGRGSAGGPDMAFNMSLESGAGMSRIPATGLLVPLALQSEY